MFNKVQFSTFYREAVSEIRRRYGGTNEFRRYLRRFKKQYVRCSTCPDRDVYAYEFVLQKESEVRR